MDERLVATIRERHRISLKQNMIGKVRWKGRWDPRESSSGRGIELVGSKASEKNFQVHFLLPLFFSWSETVLDFFEPWRKFF